MGTASFGTGAGPNITREDELPKPFLVNVPTIRVSVKAVCKTAFSVEGAVRFLVGIGSHKAVAVFRVSPKLETEMVLSTERNDSKSSWIETRKWRIFPRSKHAVAVAAHFEDKDAV